MKLKGQVIPPWEWAVLFWLFPLESELLDKNTAADTGLWAPAQLVSDAHLCVTRVLPFGFPGLDPSSLHFFSSYIIFFKIIF